MFLSATNMWDEHRYPQNEKYIISNWRSTQAMRSFPAWKCLVPLWWQWCQITTPRSHSYTVGVSETGKKCPGSRWQWLWSLGISLDKWTSLISKDSSANCSPEWVLTWPATMCNNVSELASSQSTSFWNGACRTGMWLFVKHLGWNCP